MKASLWSNLKHLGTCGYFENDNGMTPGRNMSDDIPLSLLERHRPVVRHTLFEAKRAKQIGGHLFDPVSQESRAQNTLSGSFTQSTLCFHGKKNRCAYQAAAIPRASIFRTWGGRALGNHPTGTLRRVPCFSSIVSYLKATCILCSHVVLLRLLPEVAFHGSFR